MRSFVSMFRGRRFRSVGRLLAGMVLLAGVAGMAQQQTSRPEREPERPTPTRIPREGDISVLGRPAARSKHTAEELRKRYPFESLAKRLDYERERTRGRERGPAPELSAEAAKRLDDADQLARGLRGFTDIRAASLKELHSNQVEQFIAREGFGVYRMPSPSPSFLELAAAPPIPFTASGARPTPPEAGPKMKLVKGEETPAGRTGPEPLMPTRTDLGSLHRRGEWAFLMPGSFGYVKDRDHVAGFQAHQFRNMPELRDPPAPGARPPKEKWAVGRLELVSLLKHEKPAVYVSEELPRMDHLKKAKTRPLDEFEAEALKRLQKGEDMVTDAALNRIRMMGSLRAAKQCLECHSVRRGELLGCFSYDLQRVPPRVPAQ